MSREYDVFYLHCVHSRRAYFDENVQFTGNNHKMQYAHLPSRQKHTIFRVKVMTENAIILFAYCLPAIVIYDCTQMIQRLRA